MVLLKVLILKVITTQLFYDYYHSSLLKEGTIVKVPFGKTQRIGVVWFPHEQQYVPNYPKEKIQTVTFVSDYVLSSVCLQFMQSMSQYTMAPLNKVAGLFVHEDAMFKKTQSSYFLKKPLNKDKFTLKKKWDYLSSMAKDLNVSSYRINKMRQQGFIGTMESPSVFPIHYVKQNFIQLNDYQQQANNFIKQHDQKFSVIHLDGVTGAGKTEVFLEYIKFLLHQDSTAQVLILFPEIGMSIQLKERIASHLGFIPAVWNTHTPSSKKILIWQGIYDGTIKVVVGARSALFLPWKHLMCLVIDESHDDSYKQLEGIVYHARDMGILYSYFNKNFVVLSTATPTLETYFNVKEGKYLQCHLPSPYQSALPSIHIVDMRQKHSTSVATIQDSILSKQSLTLLEDTLKKKEQVLLFLNRRGFSRMVLCSHCGFQLLCPNCSGYLTYHQFDQRYLCHLCGYTQIILNACPNCHTSPLKYQGIGVEQLENLLIKLYPQHHTLVLSSDTVGSSEKFQQALDKIEQEKVSIIIGTKMITKGFHFPKLTAVIVVNSDMGLLGFDLRSSEHTFALMQQVSGRSGRVLPGHVMIQTYQPDMPLFKYLAEQHRDAFLNEELVLRKQVGFPPFSYMVAVIFAGTNEEDIMHFGQVFKRYGNYILKKYPTLALRFFGPAPAPLYKIKKRYRLRFLWIQMKPHRYLQTIVHEWIHAHSIPLTIQVKIDVDPISFY